MKKKYLAILVLGVVISSIIFFVWQFNNRNQIPPDLSYQSGLIPQEYLIGKCYNFSNDLIYRENNKYYCKKAGNEAEWIQYYYHYTELAGPVTRGALICGNTYFVEDGNRFDYNCNIFGPFQRDIPLNTPL
jgi:hypothetical protein